MRSAAILLLPLAAGACLDPSVVRCANDRICPGGLACDEVHDRCVRAEQLTACDGLAELASCEIGGEPVGICRDGVCLESVCGDSVAIGSEECDGTDLRGVDDCGRLGYHDSGAVWCNARCQYETECTRRCGDGVLDPEEQCDEDPDLRVADCRDRGFHDPGDVTCSACIEDTSGCTGYCGDGIPNGDEPCDGTASLVDCIDFGYEAGAIQCASCAPVFDTCKQIGWVPVVPTSSAIWRGLSSPGPGQLVAVGDSGAVLQVADGSPAQSSIQGAPDLTGVWAAGPSDVHAVDAQGGIWHFDGAWDLSIQTDQALSGITGTGANDAWAVGLAERVHHYTGDWNNVHAGNGDLGAVWSSPGGDVFAVGNLPVEGEALVLRRDGASWVPEPTGSSASLEGVWGSDPNDLFAVGVSGTILHRGAGGWQAMRSGTAANLHDVWGRGGDAVYAVGQEGTALRYDGASWWPLDTGMTASLLAVAGNAAETYVTTNSTVLRYGGASWAAPSGLSDPFYWAVSIGPGREVIATGSCSVARRGQAAWIEEARTCVDFQGFSATWAGPGGAIFAAEVGGRVHRFDGEGWTVDPEGSAGSGGVSDLWGTAPDDVWAVSFDGVRHWDGEAWTATSAPISTYKGVSGTSSADVFAVGTSSIVHFNGTGWSETVGFNHVLNDVWAAAPDDVWAVGNGGLIVHYDGEQWNELPAITERSLYGVHGSASNDVWAVGHGVIFHYDGLTWSPVKSPLGGETLFDVAVRDDLVVVAAWNDVLVLVKEPSW